MVDIRYTPPLNQDQPDVRHAPALWNPNAAALWSLLFSPAFGAILHLLNARAMNHEEQYNANKMFLIAYGIIILVGIPLAIAYNLNTNFVGIGMTIGWYFAVGKKQIKHIADAFGKDYPRKGWLLPIVLGIVGMLVLMAVMVAITLTLIGTGLMKMPA